MKNYSDLKKGRKLLLSLFVFISALTLYGQPTSGWVRPGPCNTGPYNEAILVPSGDLEITQDGAVIENVDVTGIIRVRANNVTIRNFRVNRGGSEHPIKLYNDVNNFVIEDGEILNFKAEAIYKGKNFIARRIEVHESDGDGFKAGSDAIIESCWFHHLGKGELAHADGVQITGGSNITIRGNYFEGYPLSDPYAWNAAAMIKTDAGAISNVVFENNWSDGGNYQVNIAENVKEGHGCPTGIIIRNNHFGGHAPVIADHDCEGYTLTNNLTDPSGTSTIPACGVGSGGGGSTVSVTGVTVSPTTLSLSTGQSSDLTESVLPSNATNQSVNWSSSNTLVATVNSNGLVTAVTAGNSTITVTTVDGGYTATCNVTVTETTPPVSSVYYCSPSGSMSNNGISAATPWAKLQDVIAAGKTFNDGDVIYLMSGNHGSPVITENNSDVVTITKAPGETPILTSIKFSGASNWLLSDVKINPGVQFPNQNVPLNHPVYPIFENSMVQIEQSSDITIDNCNLVSFENVSAWTADDWNYKAWNGVYIRDNSQDITISQNNIKNVNFGVQAISCANALIEYNTIENFCGDGIRPDTHGAVVQYNTVKNVYDTNGNHDDIIQVFLPGITGLEIRGNILLNYTDTNQPFKGSAQGLSLFDGMHYNCIIENNVVVSDHWNGIVVLGAENCTIVNNTLIDPNDTGNGPPWLQVDDQKASLGGNPSINNIVSNNLCTDYILASGIGVTQNNVEFTWSARNTYFNDFANWDLSLKTGSPAIDAGTSTNAPAIDVIGTTRPQGSAVDVGAYEYIGTGGSGGTSSTLNPIADAFVRGGTYADDNYGSSADLDVKTASASYTRETFLKFDLSAISNPTSAILRLYANTANASQTLYLVNDNSWTESGITYNNKPSSGSVINASVSPVVGTYVEIDILSTVQAQAGGLLSLQLVGNGGEYTSYSSSEGANVPELVITSGGIPVTGVSVSPTTLTLNEGECIDLTETVSPSNATNKSVTWSSGNTSVVTVNSSGLICGVSSGNAVITVTTVDGGYEATCNVSVMAAGGTTVTLNPTADAFVRGGTYADDNYGSSADLDVKTASASYTREAFLKFDLSAISNPTSATLRLYANTVNSTQTLYLVNDDSWTESGITYNNKPSSGSIIDASVSPVAGTYVEVDVLSTVQAQAGGLLSLQLVGNGSTYTSYSSKEGANAPELVIISGTAAPVALIDEDFSAGASDFTVIAGGTWAVSGGRYVLSGTGDASVGLLGNISVHNTEVTGDFELNTIINITGTTSPWDDAAVVFDYQNSNNYCYVSLNESNDGNTKGVFKVVNGSSTELADITASISDDTDYTLEIIKTGANIVVKLDGNQIASATDGAFTGGKVGYGSKNDGATFDNLVVWAGESSGSGELENLLTESGNTISLTKIYPNPCYSNELTLDIYSDNNAAIKVYIFDVLGKNVYADEIFSQSTGINQVKLPVFNLCNGVYILNITNGSHAYNEKLIIKR